MNMQNCTLCPRNCHADRTKQYGFCHANSEIEVALVSLHKWEEPCLSGKNGAGTVFFSHCSMKCIFCQNHEISTEGKGFKVSIERLAEIFLEQQQRKAHCLEFVTPTHYVPQIIKALDIAKQNGLIFLSFIIAVDMKKLKRFKSYAVISMYSCLILNIFIAKQLKNTLMRPIIQKSQIKLLIRCMNS